MNPSTSPAAIRQRRLRARRKSGVRLITVRVSEQAINAMVAGGFLPTGSCRDEDFVRGFYNMLNAASRAGLRNG
jgi:hypothetical protein